MRSAATRPGAPAHPYPPRSCRRHRVARSTLARAPGLRPRARRAPPGRAEQADRERRPPLWRRDGAPLGGNRPRARGEPASALGRRADVLGFEVAYTPGHASHHVSFLHEESGRAFVGDTAAVKIPPGDFVLPPTPPPEIDLELWEQSIELIGRWEPASLGITHFGEIEDAAGHLALVRERLREQAERARALDASSSSDACATTSPPRSPTGRPPRRCSRRFRPSSSGRASIATGRSAPLADDDAGDRRQATGSRGRVRSRGRGRGSPGSVRGLRLGPSRRPYRGRGRRAGPLPAASEARRSRPSGARQWQSAAPPAAPASAAATSRRASLPTTSSRVSG